MTVRSSPYRAALSASPRLAEPVAGLVARFELADGRRVDVHVPHAVSAVVQARDVPGFRVVVHRTDGRPAAELSAADLFDVFGARSAARALHAYAVGDLRRARRLAGRAGAAWRGLGRLLRDAAGRARARATRA